MAWKGVSDAANQLGVSERRVRQLLDAGALPGVRVGRAWVIDAAALERHRSLCRGAGRPWSARSAWALLALADGMDVELSPVGRSRAKSRLADGIGAHLRHLRARSSPMRAYAHPSVLDRLEEAPELVRGGLSAASDHPIDLVGPRRVDGYVRSSDVDSVVQRFSLDSGSSKPNVLLRVVDDELWPFGPDQRVAGRSIVAVDLLEADDPRERRAGEHLLAAP